MKRKQYRMRRFVAVCVSLVLAAFVLIGTPDMWSEVQVADPISTGNEQTPGVMRASDALNQLLVKGRAPKTDYARTQFGSGWTNQNGCDTRNIILNRDLTNVIVDEECRVLSGTLRDPYTDKVIEFTRGSGTSSLVQIDHVVALSDAWQKGAQALPYDRRVEFANDPLNLLAVDGSANQQKGDSDAASWLPPSKPFRCQYVARQIAIKRTYDLWVTAAEKNAMARVLQSCPQQALPH